MNKIKFFAKFSLLCVIIFCNSKVFSDLPEELRREVIAFIRVGYLEFPEQQSSAIPLTGIKINSPSLSEALNSYGVQTIQRGFPDFTDSDTIRTSISGYQFTIPQFSRIFRLQLSSEYMVDSLVRILTEMTDVIAYAEKNSDGELAQIIPDDQYFNYQWHLYNNGSIGGISGSDIKAAYAWLIYKGNSNVKVGIFDNGVFLSHPDLYQRLEPGDQYSEHDGVCSYSHATHVAGLIGAKSNNGFGVTGVDWNCRLKSYKVFNGFSGWLGDINAAQKMINAADANIQILNHSYTLAYNWFSVTLQLAFVYAYKNDCLSIAAMGNNGAPFNTVPADFQHMVMGVGATNWNDLRAEYSNYGPQIKVVAPGGDGYGNCPSYQYSYIMSTWIESPGYHRIKGTSMATPLVSGLASLVKGKKMSFSNDDVQNIICLSSDDVNGMQYPGWDQYYGFGRINSRRALEWSSPPFNTFYFSTSGAGASSYCDALMKPFIPFSISGLVDGYPYWCDRFIVTKQISIPSSISNAQIWGRGGNQTIGYNGFNYYQYGVGYTHAQKINQNTAELKTFVYKVWGNTGPYYVNTFKPTTSTNVNYSYAINGISKYFPYIDVDRQQAGGCPWLFVHNITDSMWYIGDNNLLKRSEIPENSGQDLTDLYKINVQPSLTGENQFSFKIIETENDYGYIDKVSFRAIDHPVGTKIGITESNQIVTYNTNLISSSNDAELNEEENITRYIRYSYSGNTDVTGLPSDSLSAANFDSGLPPSGDSLALIFEVSNNQLAATDEQVKDFAGEISMYTNSSPLPLTKKFTRRENSSVIIVPISTSDAVVDSVIITWFRDYNLQYLFVAPVSYTGYSSIDIPLVSAIHTVEGEVASKLSFIDGLYANIDSISMLTLAFSNISDPQNDLIRDYVFETTGRYEEVSSETGVSPRLLRNTSIPYENKLFNNYPNPFNPTTKIKFSLTSNKWVRISIYDILGKEVSVLIDQFKEKGEYELKFNASNLASGIYFYRIVAGDFVQSKKMVLIK